MQKIEEIAAARATIPALLQKEGDIALKNSGLDERDKKAFWGILGITKNVEESLLLAKAGFSKEEIMQELKVSRATLDAMILVRSLTQGNM